MPIACQLDAYIWLRGGMQSALRYVVPPKPITGRIGCRAGRGLFRGGTVVGQFRDKIYGLPDKLRTIVATLLALTAQINMFAKSKKNDMAKFNDLFAFSGTIGDLVGCKGPFGYYVRSRPRKSTKPPSSKQLEAREKMKLVMGFLEPLRPIIHLGFLSSHGSFSKTAAMNRAVSHVYHYALEGEYPHLVINPANVRLSQGTLKGLEIKEMKLIHDQIQLRWEPNANKKNAFKDDKLFFVTYNVAERFAAIVVVPRASGNVTVNVADEPIGSQLHVYVCIGDRDEKCFSNSQFLGTLVR